MTELGPAARNLLTAVGHADDPSDADQERVRRALMLSLSAAALVGTTAGTAAAGSALATGTIAAKASPIAQLLLWFSMGAAGGVGVTVAAASLPSAPVSSVAPSATTATTATNPRTRAAKQTAPAPRVAVSPPAEPAEPAEPVQRAEPSYLEWPPPPQDPTSPRERTPASDPEATKAAAPSPPAVATFAEPEGALSDEVRLLERAQQARAAGDCGQALRWLDEYARRFPQGALQSESLAARALCLCNLGREREARQQLERLQQLHPESPHVRRLLQSCAGTTREP